LAAGESGALKSTQQTAPRGAIVKDTPLNVTIWSIFPSTAMAKNAPAWYQHYCRGQQMKQEAFLFVINLFLKPKNSALVRQYARTTCFF